jgi:hypothetical protein
MLLMRLTDFRSQARLPSVTQEDAERLASDMEVRNEGVSTTGYAANFTISFSERGVRALLTQAGLPIIEERGPEVLILPIYIEAGAVRTGDRNPWRRAFADLDLTHAHVPGRVAAPRGDITAAIANAYVASPYASVETLKSQYRVSSVLLAVADTGAVGDALNLKVIGADSIGTFSFNRQFKAPDEVNDTVFANAAQLAFNAVQARWKLSRAPIQTVSTVGAGDGGASTAAVDLSAPAIPVQITAEYSGLREWQQIRGQLQRIPGVQNLDLRSVDSREAAIAFTFPGGSSAFADAAPTAGLSVETRADGLVIRIR